MAGKIRVKCANCGMIYDINHNISTCPKCGSNAYDELPNPELKDREELVEGHDGKLVRPWKLQAYLLGK
jgi:predicted  nucleic acid-binding Zn-ribbon protein